jgi:Secretion system C-terminal sorting domain
MIAIQRNFPIEGRVDVAMTRIDGNNITDYGQLAEFFITVEDDILFAPGGSSGFMPLVDDAVFSISNVLALNSSGEDIPVIPIETTAPIETSTSNNTLANYIHIYPNPATDRIWVSTKNIQLQQIALYDLNGQLLRSSTSHVLDIQALAAGLYLVKVQTTAGVYVVKVLVN